MKYFQEETNDYSKNGIDRCIVLMVKTEVTVEFLEQTIMANKKSTRVKFSSGIIFNSLNHKVKDYLYY